MCVRGFFVCVCACVCVYVYVVGRHTFKWVGVDFNAVGHIALRGDVDAMRTAARESVSIHSMLLRGARPQHSIPRMIKYLVLLMALMKMRMRMMLIMMMMMLMMTPKIIRIMIDDDDENYDDGDDDTHLAYYHEQ